MKAINLLVIVVFTFSACNSTKSNEPQPLPTEQELKIKECLEKRELQKNLNNINDSLKEIANIPFINSRELNDWNEMNSILHNMVDMFGLNNKTTEEDECAGIDYDGISKE